GYEGRGCMKEAVDETEWQRSEVQYEGEIQRQDGGHHLGRHIREQTGEAQKEHIPPDPLRPPGGRLDPAGVTRRREWGLAPGSWLREAQQRIIDRPTRRTQVHSAIPLRPLRPLLTRAAPRYESLAISSSDCVGLACGQPDCGESN